MTIDVRCFQYAKGESKLDECEDAFAVAPNKGRFALADGATESSFTDIWAQLLVDHFVASETLHHGWLDQLRGEWRENVKQQLSSTYHESAIPWYAENALIHGAFSTFLGLSVLPTDQPESYSVRIIVYGDTCLFHTRKNRLLHRLPIQSAEEFSDTPILLASCDGKSDDLCVRMELSGLSGDQLWLATDAFSHWWLHELEAGREPWKIIEPYLQTKESFAKWIVGLRNEGSMRNDDTTLLLISL